MFFFYFYLIICKVLHFINLLANLLIREIKTIKIFALEKSEIEIT